LPHTDYQNVLNLVAIHDVSVSTKGAV